MSEPNPAPEPHAQAISQTSPPLGGPSMAPGHDMTLEEFRVVIGAATALRDVARRYLPDPGPDETPLGPAALGAAAGAVQGLENALAPLRRPPGPIAIRGWSPDTWRLLQELDTLFDRLLSRWGWRGVAGRRGCEGSSASRRPDITPGELRRIATMTDALREEYLAQMAARDPYSGPFVFAGRVVVAGDNLEVLLLAYLEDQEVRREAAARTEKVLGPPDRPRDWWPAYREARALALRIHGDAAPLPDELKDHADPVVGLQDLMSWVRRRIASRGGGAGRAAPAEAERDTQAPAEPPAMAPFPHRQGSDAASPLPERRPSVILGKPSEGPIVGGVHKDRLSDSGRKLVEALIAAGEAGLRKDELFRIVGDPLGILRRLRKDRDWYVVIQMAETPGRRYRILL
jgi:hypothetical protein